MADRSKRIQNFMKKAEDAIERRNYDLAIATYQQLLLETPDDTEIREMMRNAQQKKGGGSGLKAGIAKAKATAMSAIGKLDKALDAAESGLTQDPNNVGLMLLVATIAEKMELMEVAAWQRQQVADKYAKDDTANLYTLAEIYDNLKRGQEALGCYERIKEIDPDEDVDPYIRDVSARLISDVYSDAVSSGGGARSIVNNAEETETLELDQAKLRTDDQRMKVINYRLEHDLTERPDDYRIWSTIGDIAFDLDDFAKGYQLAKEYYNKALEINSSDSSIRDKLGDVEMKAMRLQMDLFRSRLEKDPEDADTKQKLLDLRKRDLSYRLKEYERRVKAQPLKAEFHYQLGALYMQVKKYEDAIGELQKAAKDPKVKLASLTNLGRCFMTTGQTDMAIAQFKRAREGLELFVKFREPLYYEAQAYESKGDADSLNKALEYYTQIYEQDISFRDIRERVPAVQQKLAQLSA